MKYSLRVLLLSLILPFPNLFGQVNLQPPALNLTFTTVDVPGAMITDIDGINTAGDMVGSYEMPGETVGHGFLLSGGTFTFFDYPNADSTQAFGINDSGVISGAAYVRGFTAGVSFLYSNGAFTTLKAPGKDATLARGINNAGVAVGGDGLSLSGTKGFAL